MENSRGGGSNTSRRSAALHDLSLATSPILSLFTKIFHCLLILTITDVDIIREKGKSNQDILTKVVEVSGDGVLPDGVSITV